MGQGGSPLPHYPGLTVPVSLAEAGHGTLQGGATMATDVVKQIRKATRRKFTAEEKIRIVLEGLPRMQSEKYWTPSACLRDRRQLLPPLMISM